MPSNRAVRGHRAAGQHVATVLHPDLTDAQRLLLIHLRSQDGHSTHEELTRWAPDAGLTPDDLDRCLVCADRAGLLEIAVGEPPCTATRTVTLRRLD